MSEYYPQPDPNRPDLWDRIRDGLFHIMLGPGWRLPNDSPVHDTISPDHIHDFTPQDLADLDDVMSESRQ